ncbi:MAG: S8 family serine peptidase [Acidobacteria bacterium]|nr:S8 family serine peptidase [Acidobacteriota bacterium]
MLTVRRSVRELKKALEEPMRVFPRAEAGAVPPQQSHGEIATGEPTTDPGKPTGFIVVRLGDIAESREADEAKSLAELAKRLELTGLLKLMDAMDLGQGRRLVTSVGPGRIRELEDQARKSELPPLRSLLTYWMLDARAHAEELAEIVKRLRAQPGVADAYPHVEGRDPALNPANDPYNGQQNYQDAADDGIDARWAWTQPNGCGAGVAVTDMEQGWRLTHEDLTPAGPTLIFGDNQPTSFDHGCAVLGAMVASDNTVGVVGIAPQAGPVRCSSHFDSSIPQNGFVANAVLAAVDVMDPGDVLLIEVQTSFLPAEIIDDWFDAIRLASAVGIIVCEAAGNGNDSLDTFTNGAGQQILNPGSADFRDSGAIMVGAALSPLPHNRKQASNFGARVNCYAWGEDVVTTGYGDLDNGGGNADREYAGDFQNTSAATPQIAGAALIVQGMHEANTGVRISPAQMRMILSNPATGTAQGGGVAGNIGIMPDLRQIIEDVLGLNPDVYLRDNVGDDGSVPTAGGISASPDIIARPVAVPNPQTAFGEGSGTENSNTLGFKVEAGQDNFLYARMKNRGAAAAAGVTARIFWSEVATLVTPAMWNEIGVTSTVNVPVGDTLVVTDPLTWQSADIPATGHYCFVGILDHPADPAPVLPSPTDFDGFRAFIRGQNNVTWRNFNVVDELTDPAADPSDQPFLIVNFPDRRRYFEFVIERRIPAEVEVWLELPLEIASAFCGQLDLKCKLDRKKRTAQILLPATPRVVVPRVLLPAKARLNCRFILKSLSKHGNPGNMLSIGQHFEGEELGRVTWRFDAKRDPKDLC